MSTLRPASFKMGKCEFPSFLFFPYIQSYAQVPATEMLPTSWLRPVCLIWIETMGRQEGEKEMGEGQQQRGAL